MSASQTEGWEVCAGGSRGLTRGLGRIFADGLLVWSGGSLKGQTTFLKVGGGS